MEKSKRKLKKIAEQAKLAFGFLFLAWVLAINVSCEKEDGPDFPPVPSVTDLTLLMYLPWATDLSSFFETNISDMERAIGQGILKQERVLVFLSTSPSEATLFELLFKDGKSSRKTLKKYTDIPFTTARGITSILNDVKTFAPAARYALTIGCHGMGWIPASDRNARFALSLRSPKSHSVPATRFFGGLTPEYQTDITTLAEGISNAGIKMEYILFDDCYMSSIEVAYDLKAVTNYLIGCASEIMAYGMPYEKIGKYLVGNIDYKAICDEFYRFYSTYRMPYGNIAVTDCSELDRLAQIMKEINGRYTFDSRLLDGLQRLDGYTPALFYDYGDYVAQLCEDPVLRQRFEKQLNRTVPFKRYTDHYYSAVNGRILKVNTFSGVTISDPSISYYAVKKTETGWYAATH